MKIVADFETTCDEQSIKNKQTSVYLWDICLIDTLEHYHGYDIKSFIEKIKELKPDICYFHNLKFDGTFLVYYFYENGYKRVDEVNKNKDFTTIIDGMGNWYGIEVKFGKKVIKFWDSFKLLFSSVANLAKAFKLDIQKLDFDYTRSDFSKISEQDIKYIEHDTEIVARCLQFMINFGLDKITLASSTFHYFKGNYCSDFTKIFPKLDIKTDSLIRKAYRGGFCCVHENFKNKILNNVKVYDFNSLYPSMLVKYSYPCGYPKIYTGNFTNFNQYKKYILHFKAYFFAKTDIPFYFSKIVGQVKSTYMLFSEHDEKEDFYLTKEEFDTLKKFYEFQDLKIIEVIEFDMCWGIFDEFVNLCYDKKSHSEGSEKQIYKLMLNSLTGKFASSPIRKSKVPYIKMNKKGEWFLGYMNGQTKTVDCIYTALSVWITSYSRIEIFNTIEKIGFKNWIYSDTDSIHTFKDLSDSIPLGNELQQWKLEKEYNEVKYLKQKCYCGKYQGTDKIVPTVAGLPSNTVIKSLNDFNEESEFTKLVAKSVKGGIILDETTFKIKL